jgi:hypothetical protein
MMGLDHPEVESALRTGYPTWNQPKTIYCEECGRDITDEEQYEDEHHEFLCGECLRYFHKKGW